MLVSTAARSTAPVTAPAPAARPDLRYRPIGSDTSRDGYPYVDYESSGVVLGHRDGYATLDEALTALAARTQGDTPAAVVFEQQGRFYGQAAREVVTDTVWRGNDVVTTHLLRLDPHDARLATMELDGEGVRALVDGAVLVRAAQAPA
jgi:hypothetical protein